MLGQRHNLRGFSLIELIVGMLVLAILVGIGAPNFTTWIQNTQLSTATETISAGLQLARAEAVRRNTNVQFSLPGTTNVDSSWTIGCMNPVADQNGDGMADCPATIQSRPAAEGTAKAIVNADVASVTFSGLGRASNSMAINVTSSMGGNCIAAGGPMRCLRILVSSGGSVRMCDPALPSSNPRGC